MNTEIPGDETERILVNGYHTFLLRTWQEDDGVWRVTLQHTRTGIRHVFCDLSDAFEFVEKLCLEEKTRWSSNEG